MRIPFASSAFLSSASGEVGRRIPPPMMESMRRSNNVTEPDLCSGRMFLAASSASGFRLEGRRMATRLGTCKKGNVTGRCSVTGRLWSWTSPDSGGVRRPDRIFKASGLAVVTGRGTRKRDTGAAGSSSDSPDSSDSSDSSEIGGDLRKLGVWIRRCGILNSCNWCPTGISSGVSSYGRKLARDGSGTRNMDRCWCTCKSQQKWITFKISMKESQKNLERILKESWKNLERIGEWRHLREGHGTLPLAGRSDGETEGSGSETIRREEGSHRNRRQVHGTIHWDEHGRWRWRRRKHLIGWKRRNWHRIGTDRKRNALHRWLEHHGRWHRHRNRNSTQSSILNK